MKIEVISDTFSEYSTIGKMYIDGVYECLTLEDKIRNKKLYGETAIPRGTYHVTIDYSPKYKKPMPHILNVPGFEGIRIHSGNTAKDTEGCILLGLTKGVDFIGSSVKAFNKFYSKLEKAYEAGDEITITIS